MKILILNAPTKEQQALVPPLGICYIASMLRREYSVRIIDLDLEKGKYKQIGKILSQNIPDVLMISALTPQVEYAYTIFETAKKINKKIITIIGGPHASALPKRTLEECSSIDIAVIGEGEFISKKICEIINKDKKFLENISKNLRGVNNIYFRKKGKIIENEIKREIIDVDEIPFPSRDLVRFFEYPGWGVKKGNPSTHIIASRGCPFNCVYCSEKVVFGWGNRRRNPKKVIDEIIQLKKKYHIKEFAFYDDLFTANKEWVKEICNELITRKINLPWKALSRVDTIDLETLKLMKRAGCWLIFYGFESGSNEILKNINKKTTIEQGLKAAELTRKAGLKIFGFFMLGNIGETKKTIKETIQFAKKISPEYAQFSIVRPDPGSPQYYMYEKELAEKHKSWKDYYAFTKDEKINLPIVGTELKIKELIQYNRIATYTLFKKFLAINLIKDVIFNFKQVLKLLNEVYLPSISKKYFKKIFE